MTNEEIENSLKLLLKPSRYKHTLGVAYTAAAMAMCYNCDIGKAFRAGLLHDCMKYLDGPDSLEFCKKNHIEINEAQKRNPEALLHAKTGAYTAKALYGESDPQILDAISYHTTGRPGMTMLEKIIFVSDYIEPGRKQLPQMDEIRRLAFTDLDRCICLMYESIIGYIQSDENNQAIDTLTLDAYEYYKKLIN